MMHSSIYALDLIAVIVTRPQQFGPSWMTIAVSAVCLFAVLIALRGEGRGGHAESRWSSRARQRYLD